MCSSFEMVDCLTIIEFVTECFLYFIIQAVFIDLKA